MLILPGSRSTLTYGDIQRVYWWYWNRRSGPGTSTKKEEDNAGAFKFNPQKPRPLQPYQAYMTLYKEEIMPKISEKYSEYRRTLSEGETATQWWPFCMAQAKEMLQEETEDVKEEVEKRRKAVKEAVDWDVLLNASEGEENAHALQRQAREAQR